MKIFAIFVLYSWAESSHAFLFRKLGARFMSYQRLEGTCFNARPKGLQDEMDLRGDYVNTILETLVTQLTQQDVSGLQRILQQLASSPTMDTNEILNDQSVLQQDGEEVLNGVVRIYCTHSEPNYIMPWQRKKQEFSTSSGFAISGRRILTNAHAVEYGSLIQVKKRQSETKYLATAVAVGHQCDLAVLEIVDDSFWDDIPVLHFGDIPELLEDVSVIGYPVGGDSISITSGVVSRIEMQEYAQASADLLALQIDAAINPGNSGGPVFNSRNEVIGVAFQSLSDDDIENIGYVVPVNVIHHFLQTIDRSRARNADFNKSHFPVEYSVCSLGCRFQTLESASLRKFLKMPSDDSMTGIRVTKIASLAPAHALLQPDDVVMSIDGIPIANDATIPFRQNSLMERVHLNYHFTQKFDGDCVRLEVLRQGRQLALDVPVWTSKPLVPRGLLSASLPITPNQPISASSIALGKAPSYLIVGGLVFLTLTKEYMSSEFDVDRMNDFTRWSEEFSLMSKVNELQSMEDQEIVLLSQVLSHTCNIGYEMYHNFRMTKCNGIEVKNLRHLKDITDAALKQYGDCNLLGFELSNGLKIVLDVAEVRHAQEQLCKEHFIPSLHSADLIQ